MNLRHAAALALVGWYLMMPPLKPDGLPDKSMPLAQWDTMKSYDSASDCEKFRASGEFRTGSCWFDSDPKTGNLEPWKSEDRDHFGIRLRNCEGRCISTDDPRLKEK
jgi:hypothetical protein